MVSFNLHLGVDQMGRGMGSHNMFEDAGKESKVAYLERRRRFIVGLHNFG